MFVGKKFSEELIDSATNKFILLVSLGFIFTIQLTLSGCEPSPKNNQTLAQAPTTQQTPFEKNKRGLRAPPTETPYTLEYFEPTVEHPGYGTIMVNDHAFLVTEGVTRPSIQSVYLLSHWKVKTGESVLDIGTGSGVQAIFAAEISNHIVATDISAKSVETAKLNVKSHGLENKIEVRLGDLFAPIKSGERFDVILFNIDYPTNQYSQFWWEIHERFFAQVLQHLKPNGRIYYQIGLVDNIPKVKAMADKNGLRIMSMRMDERLLFQRAPVVFMLQSETDAKEQLRHADAAYLQQLEEDKRRVAQ